MAADHDWPMVKLGDVCTSVDRWRKDDDLDWQYIDISSIESESKSIVGPSTITSTTAPSRATTVTQAGDVLVSTVRPNLNAVAAVPVSLSPSIASSGLSVLRTDPKIADSRYLFHVVQTPGFIQRASDLATGASYPAVSDSKIRTIQIPVPPLAEQRRIAKILDQSYSQLHDSRQLLSSLDSGRSELLAALLKQEDYPTAVLGEVAKINPRLSRTPDDSATVTFLPMAEVHENGSIGAGERREYREVKRGYTKFENEDILVAKITPCFQNKKIAQATIPTDFGVGSTEFHVVRPGENTDARYLTDLLRQDKLVLEGEKFMTGSGGQRRVPPWFFQEMSIPCPPIEEQQHIGELLGTVVDLQTMVSQKITALEELHASLSAQAFAGTL